MAKALTVSPTVLVAGFPVGGVEELPVGVRPHMRRVHRRRRQPNRAQRSSLRVEAETVNPFGRRCRRRRWIRVAADEDEIVGCRRRRVRTASAGRGRRRRDVQPGQIREEVPEFVGRQPLVVVGGHQRLRLVDHPDLRAVEHVQLVVGAHHLQRVAVLVLQHAGDHLPVGARHAHGLIGGVGNREFSESRRRRRTPCAAAW